MVFRVSGNIERFDEAVDWFSRKGVSLSESSKAISRNKAFTIAGAAQLGPLKDVYSRLLAAIEKGQSLAEFKRGAVESLKLLWGNRNGPRTETVFRNATQQAYNAGRLSQLRQVQQTRPFWQFDSVNDSRTTEVCRGMDGVTLRADDPIWQTRYPPLHHRCRSSIRSLTEKQAARRGLTEVVPDVDPSEGFGEFPDVAQFSPDLSGLPPSIKQEFERKQQRLRR